MTTTAEDIIKASASVARDAAEGRLNLSALDQAVTDECRGLFGNVAGPEDPLWPLHLDIARQVLGRDGIPADELAEWLAVARSHEPVADMPVVTGMVGSGDRRANPADAERNSEDGRDKS
jgi:hypothetical protein